MIFIVLLAAVVIAAAAGLLYWWIVLREEKPLHSPPPLFYPVQSVPPQPHAHPNGNGNGIGNGIGIVPPRLTDTPVYRPVAVEPPHASERRFVARDTGHDNAETVRFERPSDLPVQLLPGRLEVLEGTTPHREIRFLRTLGEPAQVVLGRDGGITPHHVGLGSPTVSRRHARLDFIDNRWVVKNLSKTNPLIVNDDELFDTDIARPLVDGDRLELGEVVLRFHAQ